MNGFDTAVLGFFNQFAQRSWAVDSLIMTISDSDALKGYLSAAHLVGLVSRSPS